MKVARITNDGKLLIKGEVIEFDVMENLHNSENVIDDDRRISGTGNGLAGYLGDVYWRTDYVLIEPNKTYTVTVEGHVDETMFWHILDEDYNFLIGSGAGTSYIGEGFSLNTPPTAKYIRYSFKYGLEDRISILPNYNFNTRIAENGNLFTKEIIEQEPIEILFEDTFDNRERSGEWQIERWGASPNNIVEEPFEDGWRFRQTAGGHASIAMFKQLPNITKGKLIIEFDWQPYGLEGTYKGAFFNIMSNVIDRDVYYGRSSYETLLLQLNAYSYEPVKSIVSSVRVDCISSTFELGHYKIIIDVDNNTISLYNNDIFIHTYQNANYIDDLYMEFTFGAYSVGQYSFVDNVTISTEEDMNLLLSISNGLGLTITDLIENAIL